MADRQRAEALGRRSRERTVARSSGRDRSRGASAPEPVTVSRSDIERVLRRTWKTAAAVTDYEVERARVKSSVTRQIESSVQARKGAEFVEKWAAGPPRSFREQFTDAVGAIPSGLAGFGKTAGKSVVGGGRLLVEGGQLLGEAGEQIAHYSGIGDGLDPEQIFRRHVADSGLTPETGFMEGMGYQWRENVPLVADAARSMDNTKHRITNPTEYARAVREGRILDVIMEDAANASIVFAGGARAAGAGATAARAGGAARTASVLDDVARGARLASTIGATAADAPILPLRAAAKLKPVRAAVRQAERLSVFDPKLREMKQFQLDARRSVDLEAYHRQQIAEQILKAAPDIDERIATGLVDTEVGRDWAKIPDENLDQFMARFNENRLPEHQVSSRAVRIARSYLNETLDDATRSKMDRVRELSVEFHANRTDRALAAGLRPENLQAEVLDNVVDEKIEPLRRQRAKLEERIATAERIRDRAQNTTAKLGGPDEIRQLSGSAAVFAGEALQRATRANRTATNLRQALDRLDAKIERTVIEVSATPQAIPARFRTVRHISDWSAGSLRKMADEGGAGFEPLRKLADEIEGRTLDDLVGEGYDPQHYAGGSVRKLPKAPAGNLLNRERKLSFLKERTAEAIPFDPVDQLRLDIKQIYEVARNESTRLFTQRFGVPARQILGDNIDNMPGEMIAVQLNEAGYEAYSPTGLFAKENPHALGGDTIALPSHIHSSLTKGLAETPKAIKALERGNRFVKNTILPLSTRWQVGNTIGGALMAMIGGGVDPVTLVRHLNEVRKRGLDDPEFAPLRGMSMAADTQRFLDPGIYNRAGLPVRGYRKLRGTGDRIDPGPVGKVIDKSYRANDFVDSMYRSAVYLAKKEQGLDNVQAVKVAIDAMGDYGKMGVTERRYVKQVLWFYPWTKHITTLAFRLPVEHPMRVVWTLHLAEMFGEEPDDSLPPWERGGFEIAGRTIGPSILNPFADAGSAGTPEGIARGVSPVVKVPIAAVFGFDVSTMNRVDRFSGDTSMNLSLGETAAFAANEFSMLRSLRELATDPVAYDDLGNRRTVAGGKVYGNVTTNDTYMVPSTRRRVVRDINGEQITLDDQEIETARSDLDVWLGMIGFPRRRVERPETVDLELPTSVNPDGTIAVPWTGAGGLLRGTDGLPEVLGEDTTRRTLGIRRPLSPGDDRRDDLLELFRRQVLATLDETLPEQEPLIYDPEGVYTEDSPRSRTRRTRTRNRN